MLCQDRRKLSADNMTRGHDSMRDLLDSSNENPFFPIHQVVEADVRFQPVVLHEAGCVASELKDLSSPYLQATESCHNPSAALGMAEPLDSESAVFVGSRSRFWFRLIG
jgi:hypothetical protein